MFCIEFKVFGVDFNMVVDYFDGLLIFEVIVEFD